MKIVSDNIKNALKKPTTQRKGRILINENYYEVYNVEYYADTYLDGNVVGNAIASQLDFDLPYMEKFQTFKYFDGVWTGSSYEYVDMGTFTVFDENDEDEFNKHITAFNNLIKFNAPFNDIGGYPKTLFQELQNICNQAGVELQNTYIVNGNFQVVNNQFVNGESLKTVLKAICQISGTYATIKDDKLVLQLRNKTNEIINKNQHEPVIWKRKTYGINQVVLGMSDIEGEYVLREDVQDIAQNGVHKLVINDNPFAYTQDKRDALIDALFNQVRGFGYIPYETNCEWLNYLEIGDTVVIDDIETIILRISGKSPKSLESFMSAPAIIDSSTSYVNNTETVKNQLKRTEIIVDKQNQKIESVISQTDEQNKKIAQVTKTVEELNSSISDIADITTSAESEYANLKLENINQSEPILISIHPLNDNISYLYPRDNLYPSDDLFMTTRTLRFENIKTNEIFDYELPDDLLWYDNNTYDEFYLSYDSHICQITKKVGYNSDGTTYKLEEEQIINYEYPTINLTAGNYNIYLLGYENGYLSVRLMVSNIYTTQFATRAEVNSQINQKANEITLETNGKLDTLNNNINAKLELKVDTDKLVSEINASADQINLKSNRISIESDNFSLTNDGKIKSKSGEIANMIIENNKFYLPITVDYNYTDSDLERIRNIMSGNINPTSEDYTKYDLNKNGRIDINDLVQVRNIILSGLTIDNPGKLLFKSDQSSSSISIIDGNQKERVKISLFSIYINGIDDSETYISPGSITLTDSNGNTKIIKPE